MTLYAPSDVRAITVPTDLGGCGHPHTAPDDLPEGELFALDCVPCEQFVNTLRHGWAPDPLNVGLTTDERRRQEALSDQAKARQASTWADPDAIGKAVASALSTHAPRPGGILDALRAEAASLDETGKAELAALLGLTAPAPADPPAAVAEPATPATDAPAPRKVAKKTAAGPAGA